MFLLLKFQKLDSHASLLCDAPAWYLGVQFRILSVTPMLPTCFMVSPGYSSRCSGTEYTTNTFSSRIFLEFAMPTVLNLLVSRSPVLHNPSWWSVAFELINFLSLHLFWIGCRRSIWKMEDGPQSSHSKFLSMYFVSQVLFWSAYHNLGVISWYSLELAGTWLESIARKVRSLFLFAWSVTFLSARHDHPSTLKQRGMLCWCEQGNPLEGLEIKSYSCAQLRTTLRGCVRKWECSSLPCNLCDRWKSSIWFDRPDWKR
jgi:hypothetical protein